MYLKIPIEREKRVQLYHALSIRGASRTLLINLLVVKSKRQEPREVQYRVFESVKDKAAQK